MLDFIAAIEKNSRPVADIEQGHISTASWHPGEYVHEAGRPLSYDPRSRSRSKVDAEASALLARVYRAPWIHPS